MMFELLVGIDAAGRRVNDRAERLRRGDLDERRSRLRGALGAAAHRAGAVRRTSRSALRAPRPNCQ